MTTGEAKTSKIFAVLNIIGMAIVIILLGGGAYWIFWDMAHNGTSEKMMQRRDAEITDCMRYVEFDGHEYVIYDASVGSKAGLTHSPKCPRLKSKREE